MSQRTSWLPPHHVCLLWVLGPALAVGLGGGVRAEDTVRWRMNSLLFPKVFGEAGMRFADNVRVLSGGTLDIEFNDRLVFDEDTFAAMDAGLIDAVSRPVRSIPAPPARSALVPRRRT
jgi:hypothetical protein